jgi:hypothetical protein
MTAVLVDDLTAPWEATSALWTLSAATEGDALGRGGLGMVIRAAAGAEGAPAPSAERPFTPALDLRDADELRLWLRSSRPGDGRPARPFYLAIEAATDTAEPELWRRFLPVVQPDVWALHRLFLGDMPTGLRGGVGLLRLVSLDATTAFSAALDDVVAVRPEPVRDVEAALIACLETLSGMTAIIDVPESPGMRARPFVLVTPWSIVPIERATGIDEAIDNFTDGGAFVRTAPASLQLEYRIDVFADDRAEKARALEAISGFILSSTRLVAANVPLVLEPFAPSPEDAATLEAGRTPVYVRVVTEVETGPRRLLGLAVPFVLAGPADGRETAELTPV